MSSLPGTIFPQVILNLRNLGPDAAFTGWAPTCVWPHPPSMSRLFKIPRSSDQAGVLVICVYFYLSVYSALSYLLLDHLRGYSHTMAMYSYMRLFMYCLGIGLVPQRLNSYVLPHWERIIICLAVPPSKPNVSQQSHDVLLGIHFQLARLGQGRV